MLLAAQFSVQICLSHLQHLFNPRWLLKTDVLFLGKDSLQLQAHTPTCEQIEFGDNPDEDVHQGEEGTSFEHTEDESNPTSTHQSHVGTQLTQPAPSQKSRTSRARRGEGGLSSHEMLASHDLVPT